MSTANFLLRGEPKSVAIVKQPDRVSVLYQPDCPAVIWNRQPEQDFQNWIDALDPKLLPQGRVVVRPNIVRSVMAEFCEIAQTPDCTQRGQLIDDVAALTDIFSDLMQTPYVRLRLQAVTSNACRKFHVDAIVARLICTYRGLGTQYGLSHDGGDPKRVFTTPTSTPILLRGSHWPETPKSGLLHRSPPIEGTNETRLVLVLDPMAEPKDAQ